MPAALSARISLEDIRSGRFVELGWLWSQGWRPGHRALRLLPSRRMATLLPTRPRFGGHNASTWRPAIEQTNGFECDMGYGGLGRVLGYRLLNLGLKPKQIRHRAICIHLHHDRPCQNEGTMQRNREILARIQRNREIRARRGSVDLASAGALPVD